MCMADRQKRGTETPGAIIEPAVDRRDASEDCIEIWV